MRIPADKPGAMADVTAIGSPGHPPLLLGERTAIPDDDLQSLVRPLRQSRVTDSPSVALCETPTLFDAETPPREASRMPNA